MQWQTHPHRLRSLLGGHELAEENHEPFGFDPSILDYLLLSHAYLDHCGRIPLLVKKGFKGEIITTAASVNWPN